MVANEVHELDASGAAAAIKARELTDAAVVRLLREASAVAIGKTVTAGLAFMNPSRTRNPHNLEHSPGGSPPGSAEAVAAGIPIALGHIAEFQHSICRCSQ